MSYLMRSLAGFAIGLSVSIASVGESAAQKSADTFRLAITDMFRSIDPYSFRNDDSNNFNVGIYQSLIAYDINEKKFIGILAKSWKRIDDTTIEFELRENVKFHNGDIVTSEDVKTTFEYLTDPNIPLMFKERFSWVKQVEVLDRHKFRIHSREVSAFDMDNLAYALFILNGKVLSSRPSAGDSRIADYGRLSPIGTGPYKVTSLDINKGIMTERFDAYYDTEERYFRAPVKRVQGVSIPDRQTQIAQLLTGGLDAIRNISVDQAESLSGVKNIVITPTNSQSLLYMVFDVIGRSSNKALTDERVRKAMIMAIDRDLFVKSLIAGGTIAEMPASICFKSTLACKPSTEPYKYNPAEAKRLLAEAGYPNGFDMELGVFVPVKTLAEGLAGELRKVGIRATVASMPLNVFSKRRGDGELNAWVNSYSTTSNPETGSIMSLFFSGNRDYANDSVIEKAMSDARLETDLDKRANIYAPALDRINSKALLFPISELPVAFAHGADVKLLPDLLEARVRIGDFAWSDYKPKK